MRLITHLIVLPLCFLSSFELRADETNLPPCLAEDAICLQQQLLSQVYLNESLRQRNVALARAVNIAEQMLEESERRTNEAESKLEEKPNVGRWFVYGTLVGFGIALVLHLKPFN